jgi:hypothetical protein
MKAGVKSGIGSVLLVLLAASSAHAAWHQPAGSLTVPLPASNDSNPSIADVGGIPYVAWQGLTPSAPGTEATWVARLAPDGSSWTQVPGPHEASSDAGSGPPSITGVGGTPYFAYSRSAGANTIIIVKHLSGSGTAWVGDGGVVNHDGSKNAREPSLTSIGGVPYIAWVEPDASPNDELRVARLNSTGTNWVEPVGEPPDANSPINRNGGAGKDARQPSIADVGGVPYVAWSETDGTNFEIRVARLSADEQHWERLEPPVDNVTWGGINHFDNQTASDPSLASINGVPYVAWSESDGTNTEIRVARLNASGGWDEVVGGASPINESSQVDATNPTIANFNGVPFVSWVEGGQVRVAKLSADGNSWEKVADSASPINQSPTIASVTPSLANVGGVPNVVWMEPDGTGTPQIRVSRLEPEFQSQSVTPGPTTATLSATWHTYGIPFPIGFDYGASLENSTPAVAATSGEESSTVTQDVSGLSPSTAYQFRSFSSPPLSPKLLATSSGVFQTTAGPSSGDTTPPNTKITKEPKNRLKRSKAKYKFTSTEPGSTFVCRFDKKKPKPCDAGKFKAKHLDDGKHKFRVYAVDPAGNADRTPAKDKFKVV